MNRNSPLITFLSLSEISRSNSIQRIKPEIISVKFRRSSGAQSPQKEL